jgi:hypothetical protein
MISPRLVKPMVAMAAAFSTAVAVYQPAPDHGELPNRIPEPAPYVVAEARFFPPPFQEHWQKINHPGQCQSCHQKIFDEWNGSMMSNAWRDPAWRGAFLLSARQTSTDGDCAVPDPPDGTEKARHNPFADAASCSSTFDLGEARHTVARPGSLMDGVCARCHMPTDYVDNVPLENVSLDAPSGLEHGRLDPRFNPTSDNGTGVAFATLDAQRRNTEPGKTGVFCAVCHTFAETRNTPFHNFARVEGGATPEYVAALGRQPRGELVPGAQRDMFTVPDATAPTLGYAVGGGGFRLSPHAIGFPERLGPLTSHTEAPREDVYISQIFKQPMQYEAMDASKHHGAHQVMITRAEYCSACHDVTNPLTLKNRLGKWVGGFPIERTYAEWADSRYADRPGNKKFDPAFKRDCQNCHMQQDYGQPGTAQTLYENGVAVPPARVAIAVDAPPRRHFTHHFVGGNAYVPAMVGAAVDDLGNVQPYPKLSSFSFSSADKKSVYANAFWTDIGARPAPVSHARLAWDRLRNVLDLSLTGPREVAPGASAPLAITVTNSGSGHKFPTGFPEGRIAWLSVRAYDLATGRELNVRDSFWKRETLGVGRLTHAETLDPAYPQCRWKLPAGSPDPYAVQFKAVASLGDGCPTLELVYSHPLNLVTNASGQAVDANGVVIDRESPRGLPQFRDLDGDGDVFDDAFLADTRLPPLPNPGATAKVDRYSVVVTPGTQGPVAVTTAIYYQSIEAIVAQKFLGNLADTNLNFRLEPCVLGGPCDGRTPSREPAVVEGAPPVPMEVRSLLIEVTGSGGATLAPEMSHYPVAGAENVFQDVVVKASFSEPVTGVDSRTFTLHDSRGNRVPAWIDQIGDGTWALFPHQVFLRGGEEYTARIEGGVCGRRGNCTSGEVAWTFRTSPRRDDGTGDTSVPLGFVGPPAAGDVPPRVQTLRRSPDGAGVAATFSEPVMNVTGRTFVLQRDTSPRGDCSVLGPPVPGTVSANAAGDVWTFLPRTALASDAGHCATVTSAVYDLSGRTLPREFRVALASVQGQNR